MVKGSGLSVAEVEEVECSMCGDVGLRDKLFLCKTRGCHRHQHTYCSNWYPEDRTSKTGMCNWCAAAASSSSISSDKGNMETTSRRADASTSVAATTKGGTTNVAPLKIISNTTSRANNSNRGAGGGGAKEKAAGCSRTPPGRRYKLVSEM